MSRSRRAALGGLVVVFGVLAAAVPLRMASKARSQADAAVRRAALRGLALEIQGAAGAVTVRLPYSPRQSYEQLRLIVEHPDRRTRLSTGEDVRYVLAWDGRPIPQAAVSSVMVVCEAAPASDGRRGAAFADGRIAFLDR